MAVERKADPVIPGLPGKASVWFVLAAVLGVLATVWLVVKIGNNPNERRGLPEEARLADFILLPPAGPWLGINVDTGEEVLQPGGRLADGVVVSRVMMGSPAQDAGILAGDVVERVDGTRTRVPADLMKALSAHKVGDTISMTIRRGTRSKKLFVKLGSQPMGTLAAATGTADAAWLGADVQGIDELLAGRLGLPDTRGVVVSHVYPGSPASGAGLAQGDVIRRIGEIRLRDVEQTRALLADHWPGDTLRMVVWRNGVQKELTVVLASRPPADALPRPALPEAEVEIEAAWLGLDIVPLTPAEAEELGLPDGLRGMVVDGVGMGAGVDAGFQVGDVIIAVNGRSTSTIDQFKDASEEAVGAVVDVIRYGRHIYISVPPPSGVQGPGNQKPSVNQVAFRFW